jgi:lipopolysaccharide/colanic/teichoic acid biosynthesis glycosyltransferase
MRPLDISISAAALVLLSPLLLAIAIGVKLSSPGPALYRARRGGKGGTVFTLYKFRTMYDAPAGPAITRQNDPRVTPFGRFLRRTKLDELPQLINLLKGDMSLVGPRPEDPEYLRLYSPDQRRVLDVRPGITSPATVRYRHEETMLTGPEWEQVYRNRILPEKLRIELDYLSRRTLAGDLKVLAQTAVAIVTRPPGLRREV